MLIVHQFLILFLSINALPIPEPVAANQNNTVNLRDKEVLLETEVNKSSAINISAIIANLKVPKDFNLTEVAKELKEFGINDLHEDKHLEGLPLDRHGKVNPDFHKEIFLGNHESFEKEFQRNLEKRNKKLEEIFNAADGNHDARLSQEELTDHVFKNIQTHLNEAKDRNTQLFLLIDSNQDGKITWQEYAALFVQFHHMNQSDIKDLEDIDFIQESFDDDLKRELLKIRFRWTEADNGEDNQLTQQEFLRFRHPELSDNTYRYIVNDILARLDMDEDSKLNFTEFIFTSGDDSDEERNRGKEWKENRQRWIEQQKTEFEELDLDKDGFASRDELLKAYDPMNRAHIKQQISRLFSKVDDSPSDDHLSLEEIQKHADVFSDMRLVNLESSLHEEM